MKRLTLLYAALMAAGSALALEINVTPGSLSSVLPTLDPSASSLYLLGSIDARDMAAFSQIPANFKTLGLKDVKIVEYRGELPEFPGQSIFKADYLPEHLLFQSPFQSITLPRNAVLGVGVCADSPNLTSVVVGEGTLELPDYAFYGCPNLTSIQLPASLAHLGKYTFAGCTSLPSLDLSTTSVTEIPEHCMAGDTSLTNLYLPSGIRAIGSEILTGTGITSISLPNLLEAAPFALAGMPALTEAKLNPAGNFDMGLLMSDHALLSVKNSPSEIPELFLSDSPQVNPAEVLSGATSIGRYAFSRAAFERLILPSGLEYLDKGALAYTSNLNYIDAKNLGTNVPDVHTEAFLGLTPALITLFVAKDSADPWRNHPVWSAFNIIEDATQVNSIGTDENNILFSLSGKSLTVKAPETLREVSVWLTDGTPILKATPDLESFRAELDVPEGVKIIIVQATAGKVTRSASMLIK